MLALLLLAAALGLDNFAAAIGIGVGGASGRTRVLMAVVFGLFEAGMPVLGLLLGHGLANGIGEAARWLGGAALVAVGAVGLVQARRGSSSRPPGPTGAGPVGTAGLTGPVGPVGLAGLAGPGRGWPVGTGPGPGQGWPVGRMLVSGLVLSADNLAAGFALGAYHAGLGLAAAVFGVVSVAMSLAGLELGARIGAATGERSELVACVILVAVGAVIATGVLLMISKRRRSRPGLAPPRIRNGLGEETCGWRYGTRRAGAMERGGRAGAMERGGRAARQNGMMTRGQVRGPVTAAVLCAALAGCGSAVTSSSAGAGAPAATATPAGTSTTAQAGTSATGGAQAGTAVGCAAVSQATTVTIHRTMHLVEPTRAGALSKTQSKTALVRALFRDFCDAVSHPAKPTGLVHCPAALGMDYTGTFYDGSRSLATFVYGASGCQTLSVTAVGGQRKSTMLYGTALAAAPHLQADMAAVLGVPKYAVSAPQTPVNPGGPAK